jgi:hypothetical protein
MCSGSPLGNFCAEYTSVGLDRLAFNRGDGSLPRIAYSAVNPNLFAIDFPISSGPAIFYQRLESSHGDIIAFRAGSMGYNRRSRAMRIDLTAAARIIPHTALMLGACVSQSAYEKQGQEIQAARAQEVAERSQISKMQKAQK